MAVIAGVAVGLVTLEARRNPMFLRSFQPSGNCEECHSTAAPIWLAARGSVGHATHAQAHVECQECHTPDAHVAPVSVSVCRECHRKDHLFLTRLDQDHCTACHDFLGKGVLRDAELPACLSCHETAGVAADRYPPEAAMKLPCYTCHEGHREQRGVACARCHREKYPEPAARQASGALPRALRQPGLARERPFASRASTGERIASAELARLNPAGTVLGMACTDCHQPHRWQIPTRADCLKSGCHGPEPPPQVYAHHIPKHENCVACHRPHQWKVQGQAVCRECHLSQKVMPHEEGWLSIHFVAARERPQWCTACHDQHSFCTSCHGIEMPHPSGWKGTHGGRVLAGSLSMGICQKCHSTRRTCQQCHRGLKKPRSHTSAWRGRHASLGQARPGACATCHGTNACIACHKTPMPHPPGWAAGGHKSAAVRGRGSICYRCHARYWCEVCHSRNPSPPNGSSGRKKSAP